MQLFVFQTNQGPTKSLGQFDFSSHDFKKMKVSPLLQSRMIDHS